MERGQEKLTTSDAPQLGSLGDRLAWARKERRMSQKELAVALGVDQTTIGKIERGEIIQPRQIHGLAEILGVSAAWLLFGVSDLERLSQDGINFAMAWQELPEDQRAVIRGMMDALKK